VALARGGGVSGEPATFSSAFVPCCGVEIIRVEAEREEEKGEKETVRRMLS